jgi:hypothetical protein
MISRLYLLQRRAELQQLYEQAQTGLDIGRAGNDKAIAIAERAIQIITEWPENQWPLPDEPNSWPEQEDVIAILQMSLDKAKNYRGDFSTNDFSEWTKPRLELTGGLYCFRNEGK